jgi:hypothetical protein
MVEVNSAKLRSIIRRQRVREREKGRGRKEERKSKMRNGSKQRRHLIFSLPHDLYILLYVYPHMIF